MYYHLILHIKGLSHVVQFCRCESSYVIIDGILWMLLYMVFFEDNNNN